MYFLIAVVDPGEVEEGQGRTTPRTKCFSVSDFFRKNAEFRVGSSLEMPLALKKVDHSSIGGSGGAKNEPLPPQPPPLDPPMLL